MYDLTIASDERHARFIERVIASGEVWVLAHREEAGSWATSSCAMVDEDDAEIEVPIVPFWSDRAYAQRCAKDLWVDYVPQAVPLDLFLEGVLRDMHDKGVMVGTNWNGDLVGHEAEAIDLAQELYAALQEAGLLVDDDGEDDAEEGDDARVDSDDDSHDNHARAPANGGSRPGTNGAHS